MELQLVVTEDGSHTFFNPALNEHYHSINGAIQESRHIFIKHGFQAAVIRKQEMSILEVGFGTGLNTLLTFKENCQRHLKIRYVAIEPEPLGEEHLKLLNYPGKIGSCDERVTFFKIHTTPWDFPYYLSEDFILFKLHEKIQEVLLGEGKFDLVYFDAFSPEVQPEMWQADVFGKIFTAMVPGGLLLTYSAKGEVRRTLKHCGFSVESVPGPPGKREITRAQKPPAA
ncbi:MAG TPA: tRNA (5-methylaminomethyl-2-thiouridine)(34)-methyltransferase MnmD [Bacteroidales bacterium]|nr:tRNA (5-methylaminomethyl-2-thiouridine)(34)-methyltransferase MnmD [Bacteroidales bacterium]HSA44221.1 tRNA (5-methylaminomethyl-2-thiouridine)(34)-methyltransferase MnmD [Bacteroidales bacterium]